MLSADRIRSRDGPFIRGAATHDPPWSIPVRKSNCGLYRST